MSEQLTLTEETYSLTVVEDNDLQLTLSGERGPAGAAGAAGAAGPNTITTSTTAPSLTGYIFGNGTTIAGATAAASAATADTLVLRTGTGAASFVGITNTGALNLATGTTFTYGTGIAASHRTALGLGSLATQSGTIADYLTIASASATYLPLYSTIIVSADETLTLLESGMVNGKRSWSDGTTTLSYNDAEGRWELATFGGAYYAEIVSSSQQPWLLSGWTVLSGTLEPTFTTITPSALMPVDVGANTIALAADQQGRVSPPDMTGLGSGVAGALSFAVNANGGFLTAGTGGTLPLARGGTGAATAPDARIALGAGTTGAALFGAATVAAARTTLGFDAAVPKIPIVFSNSSDFPTASTSFVNVTGLSFPVAANKNYQVAFHLNTNKNDANGIQYRITGPASPTRVFGRAILFTSSTSTSTTDILTAFSSASTTFNTFSGDSLAFSSPSIIVSNGSNAGTIQIQIRAVTSGTAKIYAGSWLQITEL